MKTKWLRSLLLLSVLAALLISNGAFAADDGPFFEKNVSGSPDTPTGAAQISVMPLYVPAQAASGDLLIDGIPYYAESPTIEDGKCTASSAADDTDNCVLVETLDEAKPLISTYIDGVVEHEDIEGEISMFTGTGFGERDAFAALSLDDGSTWKKYNLSDSALRSSFVLKNGHEYAGDVFRMNHAVVGNRVAVAWISRFCESGAPLYSWEDEDKTLLVGDDATAGSYPELNHEVTVIGEDEPYQLYTDDLFGVAGSQGSVDYTAQGFPEVGEIPYGCVWVARGTLEEVELDDAGTMGYGITWRSPERLTSGRRDANRVDITGTSDAGFIISWQEDPEGLRPGQGLGPGEGWSGAIANAKTDIWYSYVAWDHFDDVCLDPDADICDPVELGQYLESGDELSKPKISVPFSVPIRITDNNGCLATKTPESDSGYLPYCFADFDDDGTADLCAGSRTSTWTNTAGEIKTLEFCEAQDLRVMTGRTASTRVRWAIKPYTKADGTVSAWVVMAEEKMKALGTELSDPLDPESEPVDIGKNMWYHTFEFNNPEIVGQGLMLNAPALDPDPVSDTYNDYFPFHTDEFGYEYYETEIARRFNLMVQGVDAAVASDSDTSAILLVKQGILRQGGPADIFMRRVVLPTDFDPQVDNPFAYENVVCDAFDIVVEDWKYDDGSNPNYVRGLCMAEGVNVSGTTIIDCETASDPELCAASFPWDAGKDSTSDDEFDKVTEWRQCGPGSMDEACDLGTDPLGNLDDPSWANPFDVSKGHRGFIDGDFVMLMYATAPNWKANTIGNEAYNLYIRRSFDGGQTWTTLPADYLDETTFEDMGVVADGARSCEWYGFGTKVPEYMVCSDYEAGEFEQARNVSQLVGSRRTVLDPRYSPTGGSLKTSITSLLCFNDTVADWVNCEYDNTNGDDSLELSHEIRNPSRYFVTYEIGDNTVVSVESGAVPMDMFYSQAFNFGDEYDAEDMREIKDNTGTVVEEIPEWDWLENGEEISEEASVLGNPDGTRFYAVWSEELDLGDEHYANMDQKFRRIFYNDELNADPSVEITYVSSMTASYGDVITIVASAQDNDILGDPVIGIVEYEWTSSIQGKLPSTGRTFTMEAGTGPGKLWAGFHTIGFRAKDDEGNWSQRAETTILVGESISFMYMPMAIR